MKRSHLTFAALIALAYVIQSFGQTNFYKEVSSMWYSGNKTGVLSIAEQRLQQNTNDMAGLILKMEYEIAFLQLDQVTNTMERVLQVGNTIITTNFAAAFPKLQKDINHLKTMIPLYPSDELAADQGKWNIAGKPLPHTDVLKALQDDGYFDERR